MFGLSPEVIVAIITSIVAGVQGVFIYLNRAALKRGRDEVTLENLNASSTLVQSLRDKITEMQKDLIKNQLDIARALEDNRRQEETLLQVQIAITTQGSNIIHIKEFLERVSLQHSEFQRNLHENTNALEKMSGTMDGVKKLLELVLSGKRLTTE
jgi:hypothetical protein